jgi:hypothetical protein
VAVNVYGTSSGTETAVGTPESTGGRFTSVTSSVIGASVVVNPSLTRTANGYVPGPCASLGVQEKAPVEASMLAPAGAPTSENVSAWAGTSPSVALAVNVVATSSGIVADEGTPETTGATFTSATVSVIAASVFHFPSYTRTANG